MFRADDYVKAESLAEAYELCKKRSSLVLGGMVWMKMTGITKRTIVDLSGLGLDKIEETEEAFSIGSMCTLRQLETHPGLNAYFGGSLRNVPGILWAYRCETALLWEEASGEGSDFPIFSHVCWPWTPRWSSSMREWFLWKSLHEGLCAGMRGIFWCGLS